VPCLKTQLASLTACSPRYRFNAELQAGNSTNFSSLNMIFRKAKQVCKTAIRTL